MMLRRRGPAWPPYLYFTPSLGSKIQRRDLLTGAVVDLYPGADTFDSLGVVPYGPLLYWSVCHGGLNNFIRVAPADGSGPITTLIAGEPPCPLFDVDLTYLYWVQQLAAGDIRRSLRDGTGVTSIVVGENTPIGIRRYGSYLYWCALGSALVRRSFPDGTGVVTLINTLAFPFALAPVASTMFGPCLFVSDYFNGLYRSNLDGSGVVNILAGLPGPPSGIWATPAYLYYVCQTPDVWRVNHDGTGNVLIYTSTNPCLGISATLGAP